jgi:adenine-specific DNA-methyltransferase
MTFTRIHVIESRNEAFANDGVLQENIIFRAVRDQERGNVIVTGGSASHEGHRFGRELAYDVLVVPDDPDAFIHLAPEPAAQDIADRMRRLPSELSDLGLSVSTGRVVDFRARRYLSSEPVRRSVPLIYPAHFEAGFVTWPKKGKKPNAIISTPETSALLVPTGHYVLVKRFSAKEESRRIVAAVCTPARFSQAKTLGFENHLNYFHEEGQGMEPELALGLAAFLNSTNVDQFFRQFSGHTQVNARDLRKLRYPARSVLLKLGSRIQDVFPSQAELDCIVEQELAARSKYRSG